jgi:hypothetical protein
MKPLTRADLDRFFRALADRLPCPVRIVLTGGGEALFRRQVEHFFRTQGRMLWGPGFDPARAVAVFHTAARIR